LQVTNESNHTRSIIWMTPSDAAHIVWSSSILITAWETKNKVNTLLDINGDAISVFFSWDLWKIKDNRLWSPALPAFPVDYLQIESTYGWKNHRNRKESVKELIDLIKNSEWNVLISVFSQQRIQEILLTILETIIKNPVGYLDYEILLDWPLAQRLTKIYIEHKGEVYNLLDEGAQIKMFWRIMFRFLEQDEWGLLYSLKDKKHIILSTSWMMDWWAIMNHLPFILEDKKATLIAPWYLSEWTLWNEIIHWNKELVTINWVKVAINCTKKYVDWFSAHIWHNDILQYITEAINTWKIKKWATIAFNHWDREWQEVLKRDVLEILNWFDRNDVKVIIPELFSSYNLWDWKTVVWESMKLTISQTNQPEVDQHQSNQKKVVTPKFLLKIVDNEDDTKISKEEEQEQDQKLRMRTKNRKTIRFINEYFDQIVLLRRSDLLSIFKWLLNENSQNLKNIGTVLSKISSLDLLQSKFFYDAINKKITRNRELKNHVSSLKDKIKGINGLYGEIDKFIRVTILKKNEEISKLQNKLEEKSKQLEKLEKELSDIKEASDWQKNRGNSVSWDRCERWIKNITNKIKDINLCLLSLNWEIIWGINDLKKQIRNLFGSEYKIKVGELFDNYEESGNFPFEDFLTISQEVISSIKTDILLAEANYKSHLEIGFEGWKNITISITELNESCLAILKNIFQKDYYENVVSIQFNVYLFLKSKSSFEEYIRNKFSLEMLKGISDKAGDNTEVIEELKYLDNVTGWLIALNEDSEQNIGVLEDINFWLECTRQEVEKLLKIVKKIF